MRLMVLALMCMVCWGQSSAVTTALPKSPAKAPVRPFPPAPEEARANLLLAKALSDKNPDVRKEAVASLGLVGPREPYLGGIAASLDDGDVYVRLAAVASLVDLKNKGAIPALAKALNDSAPEVSFAAAKALWSLGDPRGRAALLGVLSREMKTTSGPITAEKRDMLRLLHTPRPLMIFAFKEGMGFVPLPGVGAGVSSLTLLLADPAVSGRAATVLLLATDTAPEVTNALQDALQDKDASVRAAAAYALALRDDPEQMGKLVPLLDDPKEAVRLRAAAGYLRLVWVKNTRPPARVVPAKNSAKKK